MNISIKSLAGAFSLLALGACQKQETAPLANTAIIQFHALAAPKVDAALAALKQPLPQTVDGCLALSLNYSASRALMQASMMNKAVVDAKLGSDGDAASQLRRWSDADYTAISKRLDAASKACSPLLRQVTPEQMNARPEVAEADVMRDHVFATAAHYGQLLEQHGQAAGSLNRLFCLEARIYALNVEGSLGYAALGGHSKFDVYDQQVQQLQRGIKAVCHKNT